MNVDVWSADRYGHIRFPTSVKVGASSKSEVEYVSFNFNSRFFFNSIKFIPDIKQSGTINDRQTTDKSTIT
jgi:hypothetical protein